MYASLARPDYSFRAAVPATPAQVRFIESLAADRVFDPTDGGNDAEARLAVFESLDSISKWEASALIDSLKRRPVRTAAPAVALWSPVTPPAAAPVAAPLVAGVYLMAGQVYSLKKSRSSGHLYAMVLRGIGGARLTEADGKVRAEYVYAPGAIRSLDLSMRLDAAAAEALSIRHGVCIVCGRTLVAAESVSAGIGPVCRKRLA
jgi:hypothetical protein